MKYPDGTEVRLGDRVTLGSGDSGLVVASMDTGQYSVEHPKEQWSYLKVGVMIEFLKSGLIHFKEPDPDLQLVGRASQP